MNSLGVEEVYFWQALSWCFGNNPWALLVFLTKFFMVFPFMAQ